MSLHPSNVDRPIQAEAYNLALQELARAKPDAVARPEVIDAVMGAVLELANSGQTDVHALARYAASRGEVAYLKTLG